MKVNTREKLIRIIVSSILSSDLTNTEIYNISNSLVKNEGLLLDLREILQDIANKLDIYSSTSAKSQYTSFHGNERFRKAMNVIKRKRISKNKIRSYIELISPNDLILRKADSTPVRELLEEYFNKKSENTQLELLNLLETDGKGGDEYLKGIMDRR